MMITFVWEQFKRKPFLLNRITKDILLFRMKKNGHTSFQILIALFSKD